MFRSATGPVRRTRGVPRLLPATAILAAGSVLCGVSPALAADDMPDIPEFGGKSGTGNYTRTFQLSRSWLTRGRGVTLAPGEIHGTRFAWINGKTVPMPTVGNIDLDITKFLRAGKNTIRLQVATTLNNVVFSGKASVDPFAHFADRTFTAAGLTGMVVLKPYVKAKIPTK